MKPVVKKSINAADGVHCVDIRQHENGGYSYQLCRRDAEDPHGWRVISDSGNDLFDTERAAMEAAHTIALWVDA